MIFNSINTQSTGIIIFGTFLFLSNVAFEKKKVHWAMGFLLISSLGLWSWAALVDPFLNIWDERFHALVAKNLINHPLKPTLYDYTVVDMAYDRWDRSHIWLHKQPLFLWQIALSFKLFGVNEFALRLPSILLSSVTLLTIFRIGNLLVNQRVGYFASVLFLSSFFTFELIAGRQMLEHNDVSFLAYITLSIWAWLEYIRTGKKYWILLIGMFSGMAILCKWLVGLLVYLGWVTYLIIKQKRHAKEFGELLIALLVTTAVALPWQVLTFKWYPAEAATAHEHNSKHFTSVVEGHDGDVWYHLDQLSFIFGRLTPFLILPAFYFLYKSSTYDNHKSGKWKVENGKWKIKIFYSCLSMVLGVELFFMLAQTKMPSFTLPIAAFVFIALACLLEHFLERTKTFVGSRKQFSLFLTPLVLFSLVLIRLDFQSLKNEHGLFGEKNQHSEVLLGNKIIFQKLPSKLPKNTLVFNVKGRHYIECMFYSGFLSYQHIPDIEQCRELISQGYTIAIFKQENQLISNELLHQPNIIIMNELVKGYE